MTTLLSVVLVSALCATSLNAQLNRGDSCTFTTTGERGVCATFVSCATARTALRAGHEPQYCSHEGTVPIICCTRGSQLPSSTVTLRPRSDFSLNIRVPPNANKGINENDGCPPLPDYAANAKKSGQKSWDYCIDLASSVHPCRSEGFSLIKRYGRQIECSHLSTPLVVGGNVTSPGEISHMAALGTGNDNDINWNCGGSLISERWILTAAHCCIGRDPTKHVRLGGGDLDSPVDPDNYFTIIETILHPEYRSPSKYNDIALLKLNRDVPFDKAVRPACLHTGETLKEQRALVSGWGRTAQGGKISNTLLKTTVEKFSDEECDETYENTKRHMARGVTHGTQTCYGHRTENKDTCQGDSGGPLMIYNDDNVYCTYLLIGVTSFGIICGEANYPAIYTRVSAFVPWIESVVWP